MTAGGQPGVALSPAGWLRAVHQVLGGVCITSLPPLEEGEHYDPMSDVPFTVWEWRVSYPLQTYGLSTASAGAAIARAAAADR